MCAHVKDCQPRCSRLGVIAEGAAGELTVHGDGANSVLSQVHRNLENEARLGALNLEGVEDGRKVLGIELNLRGGGLRTRVSETCYRTCQLPRSNALQLGM